MSSEAGRLLNQAAEIDAQLEAGLAVGDIGEDEWRAVKALRDERRKFDGEQTAARNHGRG